MTHTPTPIYIEPEANQFRLRNKSGYTIAMVNDKENAAHIVKCVNMHEILFNALKDATRIVCECIPEDPGFPEFAKYKNDLLKALALAEKRS